MKKVSITKRHWWHAVPVPLAHILGMWRVDILDHDLLPSSSAQPATEKALHLFDFADLFAVLAQTQAVGFVIRCKAPFALQRT